MKAIAVLFAVGLVVFASGCVQESIDKAKQAVPGTETITLSSLELDSVIVDEEICEDKFSIKYPDKLSRLSYCYPSEFNMDLRIYDCVCVVNTGI